MIVAIATSAVALRPTAAGSMIGYRRELEGGLPWTGAFALPSLLEGPVDALVGTTSAIVTASPVAQ